MSTFVPELIETKEVPGCGGYFEDDFPGGPYYLCCHIDHPTAQGGWIGLDGDNLTTDILFETLVEEEGDEERVVEGGIGSETLEGERLGAKVLECPVDKLISASTMSRWDDRLGIEDMPVAGIPELTIDLKAHAEIGVKDTHGPHELEQHLTIGIQRATEDGPAKLLPTLTPAAKLKEVPDLLPAPVPAPMESFTGLNVEPDILVDLSAADVADPETFKNLEELLVKKTRIHPDEDRYFFSQGLADLAHHVANHLFNRIAMVAMFLSSPENGIDKEPTPRHLKRLESFHLLVGRLHSVALIRFIIVHDHRVDAKLDHRGFGQLHTPHEKLLQKSTKQPDPVPGESLEESLDRVRGEHRRLGSLDHPRISGIFLEGIKVDKMPAGPVENEAEKLLEDLNHGLPLQALSHATEKPLKMRVEEDIAQVANKQSESGTRAQCICCFLNCIYLAFALLLFAVHNGFLPFGFVLNRKRSAKISF